MGKFIRSFFCGIGAAVTVFPAKAAINVPARTGDYFANAGSHLHVALQKEAPRIRKEASQMELIPSGEK